MTNAQIREALKKEIELPGEELKYKHPSVYHNQMEFVDYTEDGRFIIAYPIRLFQRNGHRQLQGGVISEFFDDAFGLFTYIACEGNPTPTINLTINFHKSVMEDTDRIFIVSHVVSAGRRVISLAAEAHTPDGRLVASCQTNMLNSAGVYLSV